MEDMGVKEKEGHRGGQDGCGGGGDGMDEQCKKEGGRWACDEKRGRGWGKEKGRVWGTEMEELRRWVGEEGTRGDMG